MPWNKSIQTSSHFYQLRTPLGSQGQNQEKLLWQQSKNRTTSAGLCVLSEHQLGRSVEAQIEFVRWAKFKWRRARFDSAPLKYASSAGALCCRATINGLSLSCAAALEFPQLAPMIQFPSISGDGGNFCQFPLEHQRKPPQEFPPSKLVDSFPASQPERWDPFCFSAAASVSLEAKSLNAAGGRRKKLLDLIWENFSWLLLIFLLWSDVALGFV